MLTCCRCRRPPGTGAAGARRGVLLCAARGRRGRAAPHPPGPRGHCQSGRLEEHHLEV